jgi:hypothetical protein
MFITRQRYDQYPAIRTQPLGRLQMSHMARMEQIKAPVTVNYWFPFLLQLSANTGQISNLNNFHSTHPEYNPSNIYLPRLTHHQQTQYGHR